MIIFIHIPKTAGTSFRNGLVQVYNRESLMFDYGPDAMETHPDILNLYQQKKFAPKRVAEIALAGDIKVIGGHFPLSKYINVFPDAEIISFVRDPLQRSYSEYLHFQRHKGYREPFESFFNRKYQLNLQTKFLKGLTSNSVIGCSEYYDHSLELIRKSIGLSVPSLRLNCNRKKVNLPYSQDLIGKENVASFNKLNDLDIQLYNQVKRNFSSKSVSVSNNFSQHIRNLKAKLLNLPISRHFR